MNLNIDIDVYIIRSPWQEAPDKLQELLKHFENILTNLQCLQWKRKKMLNSDYNL